MKLLKVETLKSATNKMGEVISKMPKSEKVLLEFATGRYLEKDITAKNPSPYFRKAVVDGYAVVATDTFGASDAVPAILEQVGEVRIGRDYQGEVLSGQAVYVPTGGLIPTGADAMVMIEYIEKIGTETITIHKSASPGEGFMQIGEDYAQGEILLEKGHRVEKKDIGVLATLGVRELDVYEKVSVSVISTGDEIKELGEQIETCQIYDANRYALMSELEDMGCQIAFHSIARDDKEAIKQTIENGLSHSDVVIISGGSSTGEKDMTEKVINEIGDPGVIVHGLAMKPGKPTIIANIENKLIIGLPGHPVSAILVFKALVAPFIRKKMYKNKKEETYVYAKLAENIKSADGKETYHMVQLINSKNEYIAKPIYKKSGAISLLKEASGYIKTEIKDEGLLKDQSVKVVLL